MCVLGLFLIIGHVAHAQNSPADYVNAHNEARRQVGVANVVWDNTLADQYKGDCKLIHPEGGPYGKNLAGISRDINATDVVKSWVDQKPLLL